MRVACIHNTYTHTHTYTQRQTHIRTCTRIHIHTHTHTHIHAHAVMSAERDNPVAASIWLHALEYACVGCNDADRAGGNGDEREGCDKGGDLNASPFALACLQRWVTHFERNACHTPSSLTPTSRLGDTNQLSNNRNNPNDPNQTPKRETNNHGSAQPIEVGGVRLGLHRPSSSVGKCRLRLLSRVRRRPTVRKRHENVAKT